MIEIQNLGNMEFEEVLNLLLEQKKQPFKIYIPKETKLFFSNREAIAIDYAKFAYSGQLLLNVSDEFKYEQSHPGEHTSILFTIKARDIESLASTLLHISYGYVNDHPEDEDFSYIEESSNYLYQIEQGNIANIACPYFVDICREFE